MAFQGHAGGDRGKILLGHAHVNELLRQYPAILVEHSEAQVAGQQHDTCVVLG